MRAKMREKYAPGGQKITPSMPQEVSRFFTPIRLNPCYLTPIFSPLYHLTPLSFHPDFNLSIK